MSNADLGLRSAIIFGCEGVTLKPEERALFQIVRPLGFILFGRNCQRPEQVRGLIDELREASGDINTPILIDQEGGRVQRLGPPHWKRRPPAQTFGALARDNPTAGAEASWLAARLIASDLEPLGITVDCAPVLDLPVPGSHDVIGDRAFAAEAKSTAELGRAFCQGLLAGGVLPVIKHIPGHGRATVDSHRELPVVEAAEDELVAVDFAPFAALRDMPLAMTAHVLYTALDRHNPVTLSATIIEGAIRGQIGFEGVLISDDISMNALPGLIAQRAMRALNAGCDVVLHCNGDIDEMARIAEVVGTPGDLTARRWVEAMAMRRVPVPFDIDEAERRLGSLIGGVDWCGSVKADGA